MDDMTWWKVVRPDGFDWRTRKFDWVDAIGWDVTIVDDAGREPDHPDFDRRGFRPVLCTQGVLHASRDPLAPLILGAKFPSRWLEVEGDPVAHDATKAGFRRLHVVREVVGSDLDVLLGFRACEAMHPVHPFAVTAPTVTDEHVALLRTWASVWDSVWDSVRASVWASVRDSLGDSVRASVRDSVRDSLGDSLGAYTGSLFPGVTKWRFVDHEPGVYPFQSAADLWRQGLVPVRVGDRWRLLGGPTAEVLWEGKL